MFQVLFKHTCVCNNDACRWTKPEKRDTLYGKVESKSETFIYQARGLIGGALDVAIGVTALVVGLLALFGQVYLGSPAAMWSTIGIGGAFLAATVILTIINCLPEKKAEVNDFDPLLGEDEDANKGLDDSWNFPSQTESGRSKDSGRTQPTYKGPLSDIKPPDVPPQ